MNQTLTKQIQMTKALFTYAQSVRRSKSQPDLAAVAAEREIQFKRELEELEQLAATQPLEHKEAA